MHGLGNDFMVIDGTKQLPTLSKTTIQQLSNRHTGVGFDQILIIEPSKTADFFCRIINADGSEAEQCGNGLRCVARYVVENKSHSANNLTIETKAGIFPIIIHSMDNICVSLPVPPADPATISLTLGTPPNQIQLNTLSLGNPHAITRVTNAADTPVALLGPEISAHSHFKNGANIGFMEVIDRAHIRLRTFERGAGETHACGSNACAATIVGIKQGWLDQRVNVTFRLGDLTIEWRGESEPIQMTGPAAMIYKGDIWIK
jgi:diaminopimelate epimerase